MIKLALSAVIFWAFDLSLLANELVKKPDVLLQMLKSNQNWTFVAKKGARLLSLDYNQIELRLLAHIADVKGLKDAFKNNIDIHSSTASQIFSVPIENVDSSNGETVLSREKAVKQKAWHDLQESFGNNKMVTGTPYNRVKGGMSVDLDGVVAFLPGSQIETRQIIKDTKELLNKPLELMILKMDKYRGNIVVSRKAITENELKEQRLSLIHI